MAKRSTHPGAWTVTDAFSQHTPHAVKNNTLKEIVDPVIKGPTCASPQSPSEDHQWCKLDKKDIGRPLKLPCVFSSTGFVRWRLTPREMGRLYNFPVEITKSKVEGQLAGWLERSLIPLKVRLEVVCTIWTWFKTGYCGEAPSPPPQTDTSNIFPPPLKPGKEGGLFAQTQSNLGLVTEQTPRNLGGDPRQTCVQMRDSTPPDGLQLKNGGAKATKSDDAEVPQYLWDDRLKSGLCRRLNDVEFTFVMHGLRQGFHCIGRRKVSREFWIWWRTMSWFGQEKVYLLARGVMKRE
ncbi:hypothetical protein ACA910_016727 [Epithemia clementina (nom. ined.)]